MSRSWNYCLGMMCTRRRSVLCTIRESSQRDTKLRCPISIWHTSTSYNRISIGTLRQLLETNMAQGATAELLRRRHGRTLRALRRESRPHILDPVAVLGKKRSRGVGGGFIPLNHLPAHEVLNAAARAKKPSRLEAWTLWQKKKIKSCTKSSYPPLPYAKSTRVVVSA